MKARVGRKIPRRQAETPFQARIPRIWFAVARPGKEVPLPRQTSGMRRPSHSSDTPRTPCPMQGPSPPRLATGMVESQTVQVSRFKEAARPIVVPPTVRRFGKTRQDSTKIESTTVDKTRVDKSRQQSSREEVSSTTLLRSPPTARSASVRCQGPGPIGPRRVPAEADRASCESTPPPEMRLCRPPATGFRALQVGEPEGVLESPDSSGGRDATVVRFERPDPIHQGETQCD